jgi:hypothetical protein
MTDIRDPTIEKPKGQASIQPSEQNDVPPPTPSKGEKDMPDEIETVEKQFHAEIYNEETEEWEEWV